MPTRFKINERLELRLEDGRTNIYIDGKRFSQCKYLLINIPTDRVGNYDEFNSIDEIKNFLDSGVENEPQKYKISPEIRFWAHCSNLQAWAENGYNTDLLEKKLAFPLLRELGKKDPLVGLIFKEELVRRLNAGYEPVQKYILNEYTSDLCSLSEEEADCVEWDKIKLEQLSLSNKELKEIPSFVSRLENLRRLNLSYNQISKIENLNNLPNLQILYHFDI